MVAAKSTVSYLQTVLPGQTSEWYDRIASEITAGRMPLPRIDEVQLPMDVVAELPPPPKAKQVYQQKPQNPVAQINIPNTVSAVLEQVRQHRPDQKASAATKSRLVRLVQGDHQLATRLVSFARAGNPDKTEKWCWEKAIHDLERDRGR